VTGVLDPGDWLERRAEVEDGVVYGVRDGAPEHDGRLPPLLTVAWLDEPAGATLDAVVDEELARALAPESVLMDREQVVLAGMATVRTLMLHRGPDGVPTASEQWRLLAGGRRWTVTAMTSLADQPEWGPRLAERAATLRPGA
jgi:hypothetical protein